MVTLRTAQDGATRSTAAASGEKSRDRRHRFPSHVRFLAYAYLVSVPFEIDYVMGARSFTFWLGAGLVLLVVLQLPHLTSIRAVINGQLLLPVVALIGFSSLGYFWSIDRDATFGATAVLASTVLTWLALAMVIADSLGPAFGALIAGTSLMSVKLLMSDVTIDGRADIIANVNDVAVLIVLGGAWLLARVTRLDAGIGKRIAYGLLLALHVWALLATGSRTGALAILLPLVLVIVWSFARLRLGLFVGVLLVTGLMVGSFILLGITLPQRIASLPSAFAANDLNFRDVIWRAALPELPSIVGTGLGSTPTYMHGILGVEAVMHSVYLGIALELGVVGLLIWAWMLIRLGAGVRNSSWSREFVMMAISVALMALTLTLELRRPLWVFLALPGALTIFARVRQSSLEGVS